MLSAGRYEFKIDFYPNVATRGSLGTEEDAWPAKVESAMAAITWGSGAERRDAGAAGAQQSATFRVRSTNVLRTATERWRIRYDEADWGITSVAQVGPQGHELEFTAIRIGKG